MAKKRKIFVVSPPPRDEKAIIDLPETVHIPITQQRIKFSMECCKDKCCYKKIKERRDRADFADRLHELSQITWGDIKQTNRKGFGYETLDHLKVNRDRLPPDARIIGFTYHSHHRMWGYRDELGIFHITGFDYDGKQYKHE